MRTTEQGISSEENRRGEDANSAVQSTAAGRQH
jgi:hypothetical protein